MRLLSGKGRAWVPVKFTNTTENESAWAENNTRFKNIEITKSSLLALANEIGNMT